MYDVRQDRPASPEQLTRAEDDRRRRSLMPLFTVVATGSAIVLVVLSCAGIAGLYALLAIGSVAGFVALQYLAWGWWLGNKIRREEQAAQREAEKD